MLLKQYNALHAKKTIGGWRQLYLKILQNYHYATLIDFGAGHPEFLLSLPSRIHRMAVDGDSEYQEIFINAGIDFYQMDFDNKPLPAQIKNYDVAICSDVLEHVIDPERTLQYIGRSLSKTGMLISHVPNEFAWKKTITVMLGLSRSIYNHPCCQEWNHPHLHRFTDIGFKRLLKTQFTYHICFTHIKYSPAVKFLNKFKIPIPYTFQPGPVYISTNCFTTYQSVVKIIKKLSM